MPSLVLETSMQQNQESEMYYFARNFAFMSNSLPSAGQNAYCFMHASRFAPVPSSKVEEN